MRGDVYDGRGFVKSAAGGPPRRNNSKRRVPDIDLDLKLGAVVGFNGEALRGVDLKMSRRGRRNPQFGLSAKIGRDATLTGDLRGRPSGHQVIYLESSDAGAFFRFTDVYSRHDRRADGDRDGPAVGEQFRRNRACSSVHNFAIHDEAQLERAVSNGTQRRATTPSISPACGSSFTRMPGRVALHEGVVRGPMLGGTIDGLVDYARDDVHLRGTLVPLYGPNNLLGQLPLLGLFLGGEKEGLVGITYEVVGRPGNPVLRINPISALAPGTVAQGVRIPRRKSGDRTE